MTASNQTNHFFDILEKMVTKKGANLVGVSKNIKGPEKTLHGPVQGTYELQTERLAQNYF